MAWLHDILYAFRSLRKAPGFTLVAVLSLTLGIGLNSAVFSMVEAVFLRSLPAHDPSRLGTLMVRTPQGLEDGFAYSEFHDLSKQAQQLSGVLAYSRHGRFVGTPSDSRFILIDIISPNYFSVLGLKPSAGRFFAGDEQSQTVIFSHEVWQKDFAGDRGLVGRTVLLSGAPYTVIGIAPPGFRGLNKLDPTDAWLSALEQNPNAPRGARDFRDYELVARLRDGASPEQASAELAVLSANWSAAFPDTERNRTIQLVSERERRAQAFWPAFSFLGLAGLVLIVACANVATLVLARSEARRKEIAVRTALGAKRTQLFRLLLAEGVLVSTAGAAMGLLLTWIGARLQPLLIPPGSYVHADVRLNASVLLFTLAVTLATALVFGLAPMAAASRPDLVVSLKADGAALSGSRSSSLCNMLVVGQIALSVVILCATGLLLRSLLFSSNINTGFQKDKNLVFLYLAPSIAGYSQQQTVPLMQELSARVAALPGVKQVSFARRALLSGSGGGATVKVSVPGEAGRPNLQNVLVKFNSVSPGYFSTMGTRILRGRDFSDGDTAFAPVVVVVNQTLARRYWNGQEALGRHLLVNGKDAEVIALAEDATVNSVHEAAAPFIYTAFAQRPESEATLMIETVQAPSSVISAVRESVRSVNSKIPTLHVLTLRQLLQYALWEERTSAGLVGGLGVAGILLAMVGLYGVIAYFVYRRAREFGVRIALGAEPRHVRTLVLRQGLRLVLPGTILGLGLALAATRFMDRYLYGVRPADPLSFLCAALVVMGVALAACYVPARRACKIDPIMALRNE